MRAITSISRIPSYRLFLFLGGGILAVACERSGPPFIDSVSPNGVYRVIVTGRPEAPRNFFIDHKARLHVRKGTETLIANHVIHFADWLDAGFSDYFEVHEWTRENVLRFTWDRKPNANFSDRVVIRNAANKNVRLLRVQSGEMFLVFDLQAGTFVSLEAIGQPRINWVRDTGQTTSSWVGADGIWEGGKRIAYAGQSFPKLPTNTSQEYAITVTANGLSITLGPTQSGK